MNIPTALHQHTVEFLINLPNIHDKYVQQALLHSAGLDEALLNQLAVGIPSNQFVELLVSTCLKYGRLHDGRHALESILETTKKYLGQDGRAASDTLIVKYRESKIIPRSNKTEEELDAQERRLQVIETGGEHVTQNSKGKQSPNIVSEGNVTINYGS